MKISQSLLRKYAVPVGVIVIYGCLYAAFYLWVTEKVPFSKAGWESKADLGDRWPMSQKFRIYPNDPGGEFC